MRPLIIIVFALAAGLAGAAERGNAIARYGTVLAITASDAGPADPRLVAALRQRVTVDFVAAPLAEVGDFLHGATGANIIIAPELSLAAPLITLRVREMNAADVVEWVARLADCAALHLDGALYFTRDRDVAPRTTRLYDVSSLILGKPDFPGPELALNAANGGTSGAAVLSAPAADGADQRADELIELITKQVAPGTWNR